MCEKQWDLAVDEPVDPCCAQEALVILRTLQLCKLLRSLKRARRWGHPAATVIELVALAEEARGGRAI